MSRSKNNIVLGILVYSSQLASEEGTHEVCVCVDSESYLIICVKESRMYCAVVLW